MGCFSACFYCNLKKHKQTIKNAHEQSLSTSHEPHNVAAKLLAAATTTESLREDEEIVDSIKLVSLSKTKNEVQTNRSDSAFDHSNVEKGGKELIGSKIDELVGNEEGKVEKKRERDIDELIGENEKIWEAEKKREKDTDGLICSGIDELMKNEKWEVEKKREKEQDDEPNSHPSKHQDLVISDREFESLNSKGINVDNCTQQEEESYDSLFSLSINSRRQVYAEEIGEREVSSTPLKQPSERENTSKRDDDHFLVNPSFEYDVEDKENVKLEDMMMNISKEPTILKPKSDNEAARTVETTSLSSWLVESDKLAQKTSKENSPESEKNYNSGGGSRRILGAIAPSPAEMRRLSELSSPDNLPGVGTVGRYWRQTGTKV